MLDQILKEIEGMSETDKQNLLNTTFPEEMEKQAAAELEASELDHALYAYGSLSAQRTFVDETIGLDKVASEEVTAHEDAEAETSAAIDAGIQALGFDEVTDPVEMNKIAQSLAATILLGYTETLEKLAASKSKDGKGHMGSIKSMAQKGHKAVKKSMSSVSEKAKELSASGKKLLKKHPGKAALIAAGVGAVGGAAAHHMSKKASEFSVDEIKEMIAQESEVEAVISEGIEMLEKVAAKKAGMLADGIKKAKGALEAGKKHVGKNSGKYGLGLGIAAGAAGAHMASKE